jgi:hypothetical protein
MNYSKLLAHFSAGFDFGVLPFNMISYVSRRGLKN